LIIKVRVFFKLVFGMFLLIFFNAKRGIFYKSCGFCQGVKHTKLESHEDLQEGNYDAKFKCNTCGAIGTLHEQWRK
jgi:hypothetical protein